MVMGSSEHREKVNLWALKSDTPIGVSRATLKEEE
jgi:hypothetical protein